MTLAPLGSFALKGRAETVAAYRVVSLERPAGAAAIAFVGRDDELRRLTAVYDAAVAARRRAPRRGARLAGPRQVAPGRRVRAPARRRGDGADRRAATRPAAPPSRRSPRRCARCSRIDDGAERRRAARGDRRGAAAATRPSAPASPTGIAALLAGTPASPEETFFVVRRLLAALAAARPVVLVIDDLQWAEPLLLDLIEHLVQWSTGVPLLVLAAARPELRDARSSLAAPGGLVRDVVTLAGLDAGAATRLAANVIGADELPAAVAGRVLATSEGNPLFVGELVRMLVHDGALKREGDRWTTGVELADARDAADDPRAARRAHRAAAARGAHACSSAPRSSGASSRAPPSRTCCRARSADLDARLEALRRSELIEPDTGWFLGEPVLRFHHVLIRDAAYRRLLKGTRAELHGRFADWIESARRRRRRARRDDRLAPRAGAPAPARARPARRAGPGARRARGALPRRGGPAGAGARRPAAGGGPARARARPARRRRIPRAPTSRSTGARRCSPPATSAPPRARSTSSAASPATRSACAPGTPASPASSPCSPIRRRCAPPPTRSRRRPTTLAAAGDAAGEAKAHSVHALALARLGKIGACEAALDQALAAARRARDRRRANAVLAGAPLAALWGPSPVTRASGRCLDVVRVLRITQGAPAVEAVALRCQAVLEALRGRTDAARRMIASSRRMVEELGITQRLLEADVFAGLIELLEGDAVAAERWLRTAYDGLREPRARHRRGAGRGAARPRAAGAGPRRGGRSAQPRERGARRRRPQGGDRLARRARRGAGAARRARGGGRARARRRRDRRRHRRAARPRRRAPRARRGAARRRPQRRSRRRGGARDRAVGGEGRDAARRARAARSRTRRSPTRVSPSPRCSGTPRFARRVRANAATANAARHGRRDRRPRRRPRSRRSSPPTSRSFIIRPAWSRTTGRRDRRSGRSCCERGIRRSRHEPLASLGDSLALVRQAYSVTGLAEGDSPDVGPVFKEDLVADRGRRERAALRASRSLPRNISATPSCASTNATPRVSPTPARGLAPRRRCARWRRCSVRRSIRSPTSSARRSSSSDHRTLGFGTARGCRALSARAPDPGRGRRRSGRDHRRRPRSGVRDAPAAANHDGDRPSERRQRSRARFSSSGSFGGDGRVVRVEMFDPERAAEALARFDELTAEPPLARFAKAAPAAAKRRPDRYVRPNAATANAARLEAAIAARDAEALPGLLADSMVVINHCTGVEHGREGVLFSLESVLQDRIPWLRIEPLATLGDSLALCRWSTSAGGSELIRDLGASERDQIVLFEVDAQGRSGADRSLRHRPSG